MRFLTILSALVAAVAIGGALRKRHVLSNIFTPAPGSLKGRTILVTGGSTGLGLESAKRLAVGGANIVVTARTEEKGQKAVDQVTRYLKEKGVTLLPDQLLSYQVLELDRLESVKKAAAWDLPPIDVLMNNAGVMALPERKLTEDGFEMQVGTNHIGHFVLTATLSYNRMLAKDCHIINVSSAAHKFAKKTGLDFGYLWEAKDGYRPWRSYGQSKLANILFTRELQRRAWDAGLKWTLTSLHPGGVATDLGRYLVNDAIIQSVITTLTNLLAAIGLFVRTVEHGATTQIWLASQTGKALDSLGGKYFVDSKPEDLAKFARNDVHAFSLWVESERRSGVMFAFPPTAKGLSSEVNK